MTREVRNWDMALRALAALSVAPNALRGMILRARAGPVRQRFEEALTLLPLPVRRIHPSIDDTQLFGGLNVAASLSAGHMVRDRGIADTPAALILPMAERTNARLAARLAQMLDADTGHVMLLLDEGVEPDENAPASLANRLAFHCDLGDLRLAEAPSHALDGALLEEARKRYADVTFSSTCIADLVTAAACFGIDDARAPLFALCCARALAALDNAKSVGPDHLHDAAALIYPCRATRIPENMPEPPKDEANPEKTDETTAAGDDLADIPDTLLIEAVAVHLPADLLAGQERKRASGSRDAGAGAGQRRLGNRRGRPLPFRPGRHGGTARIDVVATLRTAAPWQVLRRKHRPTGARLIIFPSDIRVRRFEERSDRLIVFAVDASGSAAMSRMAEAKGAVELLLAQAYVKRDRVALVAFRGTCAEVLLPPTRSLVQAKKRLSALPGGGGTPLASALQYSLEIASQGKRAGFSPNLAILTDGRANIPLNGRTGRSEALTDAKAMARQWALSGFPAVVIDTSARPGPQGRDLANWLAGQYLSMPRADAECLGSATDAALSG